MLILSHTFDFLTVLGSHAKMFPSLLARVLNAVTCILTFVNTFLLMRNDEIKLLENRAFTQAITTERLVLYIETRIFGTLLRRIPSFIQDEINRENIDVVITFDDI